MEKKFFLSGFDVQAKTAKLVEAVRHDHALELAMELVSKSDISDQLKALKNRAESRVRAAELELMALVRDGGGQR